MPAWSSKDKTPELALRQMLEKSMVPPAVQVIIADKGLLKSEAFSTVGADLNDFKTNITAIVGNDNLGSDAGEIAASLAFLGSAWKKASALSTLRDGQRARLEEDPSLIPIIGAQDFYDMRAKYVSRHPEILLQDFKEPHKRFVERLQKDYTVDELVKYYELGRIRLKSETIEQHSGLASTPAHLMRMAKEDIDATVVREDDAYNRVFALCMAMDMLGYVAMTKAQVTRAPDGSITAVSGGTLDYLEELEARSRENPGLRFFMLYDRKIRGKVFRLMSEDKDTYSDWAYTLYMVLRDHKYLLQEARNEASLPAVPVLPTAHETSLVPVVDNNFSETIVVSTASAPGPAPGSLKKKYVDENGNPMSAKRAKKLLKQQARPAAPLALPPPPTVVQSGRASSATGQ